MAALALALCAVGGAAAQTPGAPGPAGGEPFHDFRQGALEYSGPPGGDGVREGLTEVPIGWFGPADPAHPIHGDLWVAAGLAVQEANRGGGWNGLPFRLLPRWSENPWGSGVAELARMVYEDGAWAVLGSVDGASTHLVEQVVAKARLPLVSPVATDESVNLAGVPWMFSLAPPDPRWAATMVHSLLATAGERGFALISVTDHDSRLAARALLDELARAGRVPSRRLELEPRAADLDARLDRLGLSRLGALLLAAGPDDGARLLVALRAAGYQGAIYGTPGLARRHCLESAGASADGLQVPLLGEAVPRGESGSRFASLFRARTGADPDWAAVHTYDATRLLLQAIRSAGPSRTGIRRALLELSPWQGLAGLVEWDGTGQNARPVTAVARVGDGRLVAAPRPAGRPEGAVERP